MGLAFGHSFRSSHEAPFELGIWAGPFPIGDMDWPLSSWGNGLVPFRLGPLARWGYGQPPFRLGIWTGPFPLGDTDWPLSGWGYGPAPFQLGIRTGPFPVGNMDWPLFGWGYGPALFQVGIWTTCVPCHHFYCICVFVVVHFTQRGYPICDYGDAFGYPIWGPPLHLRLSNPHVHINGKGAPGAVTFTAAISQSTRF